MGCSGLALAALVVAFAMEDASLWRGGFVPVKYRRLAGESGYSRSTVARRLPAVLEGLDGLGVIEYERRPGETYRVRLVVGLEVLERWGVAWVPWPLADASHRLHPADWGHTDRAAAAAWWSFASWDGHINGAVGVEGLAARVGLRPSTLGRGPAPAGLWADPGERLEVGNWSDPGLRAHRQAAEYDNYRSAVPVRSGREGASVRWHGHVSEPPAADEDSAEPPRGARLSEPWGGLIGGSPVFVDTTPTPQMSSDAGPPGSGDGIGDHQGEQKHAGWERRSGRTRTRRTPDRWRYEQATTSGSWAGPAPEYVTGLARRFGWHTAEQAALETHRALRLGRPVRSVEGLATHFAACFARPELCSGRHRGPCGRVRLDQHRGRRLDEDQQSVAANPTPARNPTRAAPRTAGRPTARTAGEDWPSDPTGVLEATAATSSSPRVRALAARLNNRFDTTTSGCREGRADS